MKSRSKNVIMLVGFILIAATIALFFILTENRLLIDWLCFSFMLIAELILTASLLTMESIGKTTAGIMLRSGIYSTVVIYTMISIIVSIISMLFFREEAKFFVAIQIVLMVITAIILELMYISSVHIADLNTSTVQSVNKMQELLNKVITLQSENCNTRISVQLNKLYEAIRYCDVSETVVTDDIIANKIVELELLLGSELVDKIEAATKLIDYMLALMKQRAAEVSMLKAGGI